MTDIKRYADWYAKMDYEGGLADIVDYGDLDSGDSVLDDILETLKEALHAARARMHDIKQKYGDAIYAEADDD